MRRYIIIAIVNILLLCTLIYITVPRQNHKITFENAACIMPHSKYHYFTCNPIKIHINGDSIVISEKFDTDLASIPRWYWIFISPAYSGFIAPSIMHDYLYRCPESYSRKEIDEYFYYALLENGVSHYTAYKMYMAVRIFGSRFYHKSTYCMPEEKIE